MQDYFAKLTPRARMLLAIPIIATAYPLVTIVLPAVAHAVVPDVVRSVLSLI